MVCRRSHRGRHRAFDLYEKKRQLFKTLCYSAFQGTAALFAVNALAGFTGVSLAVNGVTLAVGGLGGLPGVILLLSAQAILR